ncbi:hypothetical protein E8E11_000236 [Didymella keratinophila]|nr:hypothetical protein E8E11_000236 [Didymella keratinophila]
MTECEPDPPPAEQSALSFAIRAFHHEQVDGVSDRPQPPHIQINATQDLPTSFSPSEANGIATERRDSIHRETLPEKEPEAIIAQDDPDRPRAKHDVRAKSPSSTVTTMRRMQVQAMLSRCQLLQATILSLDCRQKSHKTAAEIQTHHETMEQLARRALLMAQDLRGPDLLARAEDWSACANTGIDGQAEAIKHRKTMRVLDQTCHDIEGGKDQVPGTTAKRSREDDVSLRTSTRYSATKQVCDGVVSPSRRSGVQEQKCMASRRDSLSPDQLLTVKDELDAMVESLDYEDGYGDMLDYLEDETFDPRGLLSQLK